MAQVSERLLGEVEIAAEEDIRTLVASPGNHTGEGQGQSRGCRCEVLGMSLIQIPQHKVRAAD